MTSFLYALILSILPVSELRGGIPLAIGTGVSPIIAFLFATAANIMMIPIIFFFLDYFHDHFMKIKPYKKLFTIYLNRLRRKVETKTLGFFLLFSFVAIPLPGTGAYTGCILSWFFQMHRKKSTYTIALGVLVAGIIITLASTGFFRLLL